MRAGLPAPAPGEPLLPGPVLAAPYHLPGPADASPFAYGRDANPTWTAFERAVGELEGGRCVAFASGQAATSAVLLSLLAPGDVLVLNGDGYPGARGIAAEQLAPRGITVRARPTDTAALVAAVAGATLVWIESPANPGLEVCDIASVAEAAHWRGRSSRWTTPWRRPWGRSPSRSAPTCR